MNRKGQVSIEYLILTGFIVLAIIVPSAIFLYSVTNQNVQGTLSNQKASDLGNGLVNDAKQMYYLGLYSNKIVEHDVPDNVKYMYVFELDDGANKYYYFGLIISDGKKESVYNFQSDVPLTSEVGTYVTTDDSAKSYIQECQAPGNTCNFFSFKDSPTKPGKKQFKIETKFDGGDVKSSITPFI